MRRPGRRRHRRAGTRRRRRAGSVWLAGSGSSSGSAKVSTRTRDRRPVWSKLDSVPAPAWSSMDADWMRVFASVGSAGATNTRSSKPRPPAISATRSAATSWAPASTRSVPPKAPSATVPPVTSIWRPAWKTSSRAAAIASLGSEGVGAPAPAGIVRSRGVVSVRESISKGLKPTAPESITTALPGAPPAASFNNSPPFSVTKLRPASSFAPTTASLLRPAASSTVSTPSEDSSTIR